MAHYDFLFQLDGTTFAPQKCPGTVFYWLKLQTEVERA